jgi:hypothetical protein
MGDPEQLAKIMETDPYFITQDNGAGAPIHFATTYRQLDMVRAAIGAHASRLGFATAAAQRSQVAVQCACNAWIYAGASLTCS